MKNFKDYNELSNIISADLLSVANKRPIVVFMSALQGLGKTTLAKLIRESLNKKKLTSFVCSIDDFYLTNKDLVNLNERFGLFSHRGCPGSHDHKLLQSLIDAHKSQVLCRVPTYDKQMRSGKGDRVGYRIYEPSDVLVVEGWFLGITSHDLSMENDYVKFLMNYDALWRHGDYWILFSADTGLSIEGRKRADKMVSTSSQIDVTEFLEYMWSSISPKILGEVLQFDGERFKRGCMVNLMPDYTGTVSII